MEKREFTITSETGIHARPATILVQAVGQNAKVTITANGDDEKEALDTVAETMKKEGLTD